MRGTEDVLCQIKALPSDNLLQVLRNVKDDFLKERM